MSAGLDLARLRWSLTEIHLIADTATSRVYRAKRPDASLAALKILKPYGADEIVGARLMVWYGGTGAARIIDVHEPMILMDWLSGPPLGDLVRSGHDDKATGILCDVAVKLHQPRGTPPADLDPLRRRFETLIATVHAAWPLTHRSLVDRAIAIALGLFETAPPALPLHGDFHHDNVVSDGRDWLAIDPKGLSGDPAYEVANVFRNPFGANELAQRPERIEALADVFSARLGLDRRRILQWAAAHSALSACWDHAAGNPIDWDLTMLPRLLAAVDRVA